MPNGHREPYRLRPRYGRPSPVHSSDSEETYDNKLQWRLIALRVFRRWRRLRRRRVANFIRTMVWRHQPRMLPLAPTIALFLV